MSEKILEDKIRWGILSTGSIAHSFATALTFVPGAELVAVGSRTLDSAQEFANRFHVPHVHATYEALANDPDVDVVYIATPHALHHENMLLSLNAGKAVLCEKPFTINAKQAADVVRVVREKKLFLMEGMWTRFIPLIARLRELIAARAIGDLKLFVGGLGKIPDLPPTNYMFKPELGGGVLLDAGIYPVSLACMMFGAVPTRVTAFAEFDRGVDVHDALTLEFGKGQLASIYMSLKTTITPKFDLYGTAGSILVDPPLFFPTRLTIKRADELDSVVEMPIHGHGLNYEAVHVHECLRAGELESPIMPLDETVAIMQTMDRLREQIGLKYPFE